MKQIVLIADLNKWKEEAEFITEMFHLTATGVLTINIGHRLAPADLNARELRQVFPGKTLDDSVGEAVAKLYSQGIADGILCLVGKDPGTFSTYAKALAAMPFGLPKIAIISRDSAWQAERDIISVHLPGDSYNLNPVIKICLGNVVFAVSGMSLCNIHNFGSTMPTIGIAGCGAETGSIMKYAGLNYLVFSANDGYIRALLHYGYIQGLLLGNGLDQYSSCIEIAADKDIPIICVGKNPEKIRSALIPMTLPDFAPVLVVTSAYLDSSLFSLRTAAASESPGPSPWLKHYNISHRFGSEAFYKYACQLFVDMLI